VVQIIEFRIMVHICGELQFGNAMGCINQANQNQKRNYFVHSLAWAARRDAMGPQ